MVGFTVLCVRISILKDLQAHANRFATTAVVHRLFKHQRHAEWSRASLQRHEYYWLWVWPLEWALLGKVCRQVNKGDSKCSFTWNCHNSPMRLHVALPTSGAGKAVSFLEQSRRWLLVCGYCTLTTRLIPPSRKPLRALRFLHWLRRLLHGIVQPHFPNELKTKPISVSPRLLRPDLHTA